MDNQDKNINLVEGLFGVGAHYGYARSRRHPSVAPYLHGWKNKSDIIDLEKTEGMIIHACDFLYSLGMSRMPILFASSKKEAEDVIRSVAKGLEMPYVAGRWIGGSFTNFVEIRKRMDIYLDLLDKREKGHLAKYTKKERLDIDREIDRLEKNFGGLVSMKALPKAIVVVDSKHENSAVKEAKKIGIPVVAIANTDCDQSLADYSILANDSSRHSIAFVINKLGEAYKLGLAAAPQVVSGAGEPGVIKSGVAV